MREEFRVQSRSNGQAPNYEKDLSASCYTDSMTVRISAGFYRVEVLNRFVQVAEYFVVKGYPKKSCWSVLTSDNHLQTPQHFKRLRDARAFCLYQSS